MGGQQQTLTRGDFKEKKTDKLSGKQLTRGGGQNINRHQNKLI